MTVCTAASAKEREVYDEAAARRRRREDVEEVAMRLVSVRVMALRRRELVVERSIMLGFGRLIGGRCK